MGLLDTTTSIPAIAYGAEPFSIAELDAHPDRARLWATIRALRTAHEADCEAAWNDGYRDGFEAGVPDDY